MELADQTYRKISVKMPEEAQYVVPFAYNLRWYMTMNLREAYHFCELRSTPQGHIDYRRVAQQMYQEIKKVHPFVEMLVDMKEYGLERLEAEKWIDKRLEEVKKKYS
jgi:thymidylate synthase ThyX